MAWYQTEKSSSYFYIHYFTNTSFIWQFYLSEVSLYLNVIHFKIKTLVLHLILLFLSKIVTHDVAPLPRMHCRRHPERRERHSGMDPTAEGRGRRYDPDRRQEEEEWLEWRTSMYYRNKGNCNTVNVLDINRNVIFDPQATDFFLTCKRNCNSDPFLQFVFVFEESCRSCWRRETSLH